MYWCFEEKQQIQLELFKCISSASQLW